MWAGAVRAERPAHSTQAHVPGRNAGFTTRECLIRGHGGG
ncbi:hypothetical protein ApDm4_1289 [Acetobacter pomorum]|nr:hypothetical protein ApDm4_1289 [Acetobacter pomorum]